MCRHCFSLTVPPLPLQELTHNIYASGTVPNILAKFYLAGEAKQVGQSGNRVETP